jgi:hypothetical protein
MTLKVMRCVGMGMTVEVIATAAIGETFVEVITLSHTAMRCREFYVQLTGRKIMKSFRSVQISHVLALVAMLFVATAAQAVPVHPEYYVGIDNRPNVIGGAYNGLPNPNFNRLTFLFAHTDMNNPSTNHFHGIGTYSYTGPASSPTVLSTNSNNRIPETFTGIPPLPLTPGTGVHAAHLVTHPTGEEYSDLTTKSVQALSGFPPGSPEHFLFNSSGGRWSSPLTGSMIAYELVSLSPGLHVSNEMGVEILRNVGDTYAVGDGDNFTFMPTLWTEDSAPVGTYSATFRLLDFGMAGGRTPFGPSGTFNFDVQVAPEPSTWVLLMLGAGALVVMSRRRRLGRRGGDVA